MALYTILGRSAARVKPIATRLVSSQRTNYHTLTPTLYSVVKSQPSHNCVIPTPLSSLRRYSAAASSSSAIKTLTGYDRKLLKVIDSKIECAEEDEDDLEVVEEPYRFPFYIEDVPGEQTITLTRYQKGETIKVEVDMPINEEASDSEVDRTSDSEVDRTSDSEVDMPNDEEASKSYLTLVVKVVKRPNLIFEFGCTAYPDEITIDSLSVTMPDDSPDHENDCKGSDSPDHENDCEGSEFLSFRDLDDDLHKAFVKYLEVRGINISTTNYLHQYMIRKEKREYSDWLKKLKKFMQA